MRNRRRLFYTYKNKSGGSGKRGRRRSSKNRTNIALFVVFLMAVIFALVLLILKPDNVFGTAEAVVRGWVPL